MKVAILSRERSWVSVKSIELFASKVWPISLVVIETAERTKVSATEAAFAAAHAEHTRIMWQRGRRTAPNANPLRFLWSRLPAGLKARARTLLGRDWEEPKPSPPVEEVARRHGIPIVRVDRHSSEATKAALEEHGIAIALLASSAWLIKEPLLSMTDTKVINVHQGRLPRHRSLDSMPWSVMEGDQIGHTAHFVDAGVDTGPILLFREVPLRPDDTLLTLRGRIDSLKPRLFHAAVSGLANDSIVPAPQNAADGIHHRPMTVEELLAAEDVLQDRLKRMSKAGGCGSNGHAAAAPLKQADVGKGLERSAPHAVEPARSEPNSPAISVVMAAYNAEKYLAQAVNSILRQRFANFEFVIINDGSSDRTGEILQSYARRDGRIHVVTQANAGVAAALSVGLALARGEFIARMDADDLSMPTRLQQQLAYMKAHPDCVAVGCRWLAIDPDGWPIRIGYQPQTHEAIDEFHLAGNGGGMPGPALFLRRAAVEDVGRYRAEFVLAEDYDLLLRLAEVGRLTNLDDVLFLYREHATSLLRTRRADLKRLTWKAQKEAHERRRLAFDRPPPTPVEPLAQNLHLRWARYALAAEYFPTARRHAWRQFLQTRSARPLRILFEAAVRQAAEPWLWIYDLLRFRRPRNRSRVHDPIRSERRVREFVEEMAAGAGAARPSTADRCESAAGATERRADRQAACGCAAVRGVTGEVSTTKDDVCSCAAGAAVGLAAREEG